jgi:hypothetical protein
MGLLASLLVVLPENRVPAYDAAGFYTKLGFDLADPQENLPPEIPAWRDFADESLTQAMP